MNNLKPCPFCGGEAELCYGPGLGTDSCRGYTLQASCNECCAKSPGLWQERRPEPDDAIWKDAADEWNWRPGEEALKQLWSSNLDIIGGELNKQLAEARAEIERKNALIEQMREALKSAEVVIDFYEANNEGAGRGIGKMVKAALSAERGEGV